MPFEYYLNSEGKRLRCGYTTGTCAALAAAGAASLLISGAVPASVSLMTPKGIPVETELCAPERGSGWAKAGVAKDAGDDCDVTDGLVIFACVSYSGTPGIRIEGGEGVGRVTKPGLDQPVGEAAINSVPREMIARSVAAVCEQFGCTRGLLVTLSIPGGEALAAKTFNPSLGIQGGLSILGTSGIVEPMSRQALVDTISLHLRQGRAEGKTDLILTPGNYGLEYLSAQGWDSFGVPVVRCSNFIGDALDEAGLQGYQRVLLVGHAGKLVKLAGGIFNTHSRNADARMELLCAHAALCGADSHLCSQIMDCVSCDAAREQIEGAGLWEAVSSGLMNAIDRRLKHRACGAYQVGAVVFSNHYGLWGMTKDAEELICRWK